MINIIPALDIIEGKCVRLNKGEFSTRKVYSEDPLEVAQSFEGIGLKRLHVVDLDGAKSGHIVHYKILEKLASKTQLAIDFGGGLRSDDDLRIAFECGASQITAGSVAVKSPETVSAWLKHYGEEKIILGADVKDEKIAIHGWQEKTEILLDDFISDYEKQGIRYLISTDIDRDGELGGPNVALYQKLAEKFPKLHIIASGGVSSCADIEKLAELGLFGVIVGKALYEGSIRLKELGAFLC